jgi:rare lipoprotein A
MWILHRQKLFALMCIISLLQLTACGTMGKHHRYSISQDCAPNHNIDVSKIPDAVPKDEPRSRYGNPKSYRVLGKNYHVLNSSLGYDEKGIASWYGMKFHSHRTSSGERYDLAGMTAAHKTLPIPCYARVTNLENGRQVIVKINDRGPFHENRIIDLSYAAAKKLAILGTGTGLVEVTTIDPRHPDSQPEHAPLLAHHGKPLLYLQIGAFADRNNAVHAVSRIKRYTLAPIKIVEGSRGQQAIYRVHIGPLANVDTSDTLHHALLNAGLGNPMTVVQ